MEMDGLNFSKAILTTATFSWSNLRLASFAGAELKDVVFEACDLEGTDFTGATFDNVTFKDCLDLENAFLADVRYIPTPHQHQDHEPSVS
ncbi:MAG: pentapeptide repeat-containing protein [Nitrospira sp.]|nr:pentapeptide repeat-containing protein [Nitrospira sp.]